MGPKRRKWLEVLRKSDRMIIRSIKITANSGHDMLSPFKWFSRRRSSVDEMLLNACRNNDGADAVRTLLQEGADPNCRESRRDPYKYARGMTPLGYICAQSTTLPEQVAAAEVLLNGGARPDGVMHFATRYHKAALVRLLVASGAQPCCAENGKTPLYAAVDAPWGAARLDAVKETIVELIEAERQAERFRGGFSPERHENL